MVDIGRCVIIIKCIPGDMSTGSTPTKNGISFTNLCGDADYILDVDGTIEDVDIIFLGIHLSITTTLEVSTFSIGYAREITKIAFG